MRVKEVKDLFIEGTNLLPTVIFTHTGILKLEGRIIPDHIMPFFRPLIYWINNLSCQKVFFVINIEYMNVTASKALFQLLEALNNNNNIGYTEVTWSYEEYDEEYLEIAQIFAEKLLRIRFHYNCQSESI